MVEVEVRPFRGRGYAAVLAVELALEVELSEKVHVAVLVVKLEVEEKVSGHFAMAVALVQPEVEVKVKEDVGLVQLGPIVSALGIDLAREDLAGSW